VIFDAALGASSLSWTLVQPAVARVTRACAYDRAGFGWSDAGPLPRTAGRIAGELSRLLAAGGVPPPYLLVGHSFGALVSRALAPRLAGALAGAVFVEPAHPEEWLEPAEEDRRQIARGVRLCRYGAGAARIGAARLVAALAALGALAPARALVALISRGGLSRADEEILAPVWKLPPDARRPLRRFWTEPRFFEALGSQIGAISESAREAQGAGFDALAHLPVTVVASPGLGGRRLALHAELAARSSAGRLVMARTGGHWVPLDDPDTIVAAVSDIVQRFRLEAP